jgi:hypothetical protein
VNSILSTSALAVELSGHIRWNDLCPSAYTFVNMALNRSQTYLGYSALGQAKVVLDDGFASGSVAKDGRFLMCAALFTNLPAF